MIARIYNPFKLLSRLQFYSFSLRKEPELGLELLVAFMPHHSEIDTPK